MLQMAAERVFFPPAIEEFIALSAAPQRNQSDQDRLSRLAGRAEVVESLAHRYWSIRKIMESAGEEAKRRLEQDPAYKAARILITSFSDSAIVPVRQLMVDRYGFRSDVVEGLADSTVLGAYFDFFGFMV